MTTTIGPTTTSVLVIKRSATGREELAATTSAVTSISSSPTSSETASPKPASTSANASVSSNQSSAKLIGGIAGGVAALLIIIALIAYLVYRAKKNRKRFTLLHWRSGHRTKDALQAIEAGEATCPAQAENQPSNTAVETITLDTRNEQSRTTPSDPSPTLSLELRARIDSPEALPPTTFPVGPKPSMGSGSKGAYFPRISIPRHPSSVHPAFRQRSATPDSTTSLMNNISASSQTPSETTPELFDTGFYRGRTELSSNPSRELINVPYDDRWRNRKRVSLCHPVALPTPVVTPEGAVLTANFDTVPVEPDSRALSFRQVDSPRDSSPPPAYRFSWRRWSGERLCKKEKEREKEKTESMRRGSTIASIRRSIQSQRHECEMVEEDKEGEEREEK
ncbi:hypothetical protein BJX62DRAFT_235076 [Aspergillus germanicus]